MQIPTNFSAAQAASIASQSSARDKAAADVSSNATSGAKLQGQLEQSQSANADRDAQGQGDGLGPQGEARKHPPDQNDVAPASTPPEPAGDPPNRDQLDLMC